MANVIAVVNSKGGVGKTTFAQNFLLPALGKAVFVDTDVCSPGISFIENSKYLVKGIELKTIEKDANTRTLNIENITNELMSIISQYENENIIIDVGPSVITDAVIHSIIPTGIVNMVFIPKYETTPNVNTITNFGELLPLIEV